MRLVWTVTVVPLGSAVVAVHHQENLDQEVEKGVVLQLLPDETARADGAGVLQVELAEDLVGVAL